LTVYKVSDVRQIEIHTAQRLVSGSSPVEVEIAIRKLKTYNLPDIDQSTAELIKTGGETLRYESHILINSVEEELPDQWKESVIILVYMKDDKPD
jgi:hypothetical protein